LKALFPDSPDPCVPVPSHLAGEILIEDIIDDPIIMKSIGPEPCSKGGVPVFIPVKNLLSIYISVRVDENCLLVGKMDIKAQDTWFMVMHLKEIETPACFTATDVSGIQVLLDLINTGAKLHGGAVMTLVDILVNIFDGLDRHNRLYIDVASVLPDEILAMANDPSIVQVMLSNLNSLASVGAPSPCIRVISDCGMLPKGLRKPLSTGARLHAG
jgi:hypothetical protein